MYRYGDNSGLDMKGRDENSSRQAADDPDEDDSSGETNDPDSPIWDGSPVHYDSWGTDPTQPDPNEISQD